jgi:hypothetical protein
MLPKFNKADIYHDDIHPGNIFYKKHKVYLGDWGRLSNNRMKDSLRRPYYSYYEILKYDIYMAYIINQKGLEEIENHLKEVNLYDNFINYVEEKTKKEFIDSPFKPKDFYESTYLVIYRMKLGKTLVVTDKSGYIYNETQLPKDIEKYIEHVENMIPKKKKNVK